MREDKGNLVSVIIPTFNRGKVLERAILSVLNQDYKDIEIIIIDDGSTDNTREIVSKIIKENSFSDIKYYYKENEGVSVARNFGASISNGEYLSFLDSDDEYLSKRISKCIKESFLNKKDFIISGDMEKRNIFLIKNKNKNISSLYDFAKKFPSHSSSLFFIKKNVFLNYLFDKNQKTLEDTDFIIRYLINNKILFLKDNLVIRHKESLESRLSSDSDKKIDGIEKIIYKIKSNKYNIKEKKEINIILSRLYFQLAIFNFLKKKRKESIINFFQSIKYGKIISLTKIKSFIFIIILFIPLPLYLYIILGKIFWKIGILKAK